MNMERMRVTIVAVLAIAGAALLAAALFRPETRLPEGWEPVNRQLSEALHTYEIGSKLPGAVGQEDQSSLQQTEGVQAVSTEQKNGAAVVIADTERAVNDEQSAEQSQKEDAALNADSGLLNINRASAAQLEQLPGIGPAKARAIIEDRDRNGPFRKVEELTRVKGIGDKLLEKVKPSITTGY